MVHQFCHVSIFSDNLDKSAEFYQKLFNWKITPMMSEYSLFDGAGGVGGGFFTRLNEGEDRKCVFIEVADIDAKLAEIAAAGGQTVQGKMEIPGNNGYMAMFKDCCGNTMGLWSPPLEAK